MNSIVDKVLAAVVLLVSLLGIIIRKMQLVNQFHSICNVLCNHAIYGAKATKLILEGNLKEAFSMKYDELEKCYCYNHPYSC